MFDQTFGVSWILILRDLADHKWHYLYIVATHAGLKHLPDVRKMQLKTMLILFILLVYSLKVHSFR